MSFPSKDDFLAALGIDPDEFDAAQSYLRYKVRSPDGRVELDFSFSELSHSFQVRLTALGMEVALISSELVSAIQLRREQSELTLNILLELEGASSEAVVTLEPSLSVRWWTLRA
jgi:hypothetical protein